MTYFLNDQRRQDLIRALAELTMPQHMANKFAGFGDNLAELDVSLAALTRQSTQYADELSNLNPETDGEEGGILVKFILADIYILRAYKEEAQSRDISHGTFPLWLEATKSGIQLTNDAMAKFMAKRDRNRTVH